MALTKSRNDAWPPALHAALGAQLLATSWGDSQRRAGAVSGREVGMERALAIRMGNTIPPLNSGQALSALVGAQLLWMGLRAAKIHHGFAMVLGTYLLVRAFAPPRAKIRRQTGAPATDVELGQQPARDVAADPVDAASWASFPASDPPSHSPRSTRQRRDDATRVSTP